MRSIGSDLRMDYTAVGQTTHLAARMEQMATPGSILLAPDTLQLAEGYVQVKALGPMAVKGLSEPSRSTSYSARGRRARGSRPPPRVALTRFVGRDAELETLPPHAGAGRQRPRPDRGARRRAGVGKSRLVWEFSHSHRTQGWLVLESGSVVLRQGDLLPAGHRPAQGYCGIEARDDPRRSARKADWQAAHAGSGAASRRSRLLALLDVPVDDPGWEALDPPQRRQRTLDAVQAPAPAREPGAAAAAGVRGPALDRRRDPGAARQPGGEPARRPPPAVGELPARVRARLGPQDLLSAAPARPAAAGERRTSCSRPCSGTTRGSAAQAAADRAHRGQSLLPRRERPHAGGDRGARAASGAATGWRSPPESTQVPATVQAVLAARIDRLPPEDKRLLQAAAVIGKDVPFAAAGGHRRATRRCAAPGLAVCRRRSSCTRRACSPTWSTPSSTRSPTRWPTAACSRSAGARCTRIVEAIEEMYPDRSAEHTERLAHHAFRGEVWDKAVTYLRGAGTRAFARSAHRRRARL